MPISVNWGTKVITVPKADTTLVDAGPPEIRSYDVYEKLWKELKAIEDDMAGMAFVDAQSHNTTVTVGGVALARVVQIINGYTVTFENGTYEVDVIGANHNILDVANLNQVALRSANSAGLINPNVLGQLVETGYTLQQALRVVLAVLAGKVSGGPGSPVFRDINDTKNRLSATADVLGNRTAITVDPD